MDKLTFEQYCNEPAFPEFVSVSAFVYKDGSTGVIEGRSKEHGLTRLDHFTESAMKILLEDALRKGLSADNFLTAATIGNAATTTAMAALRSIYKEKFE